MAWQLHNTTPLDYCAAAKRRAAEALRTEHTKNLTRLEQAFVKAIKEGRIDSEP